MSAVLFWILCCVVCKKNENKKLLITKKKNIVYGSNITLQDKLTNYEGI